MGIINGKIPYGSVTVPVIVHNGVFILTKKVGCVKRSQNNGTIPTALQHLAGQSCLAGEVYDLTALLEAQHGWKLLDRHRARFEMALIWCPRRESNPQPRP